MFSSLCLSFPFPKDETASPCFSIDDDTDFLAAVLGYSPQTFVFSGGCVSMQQCIAFYSSYRSPFFLDKMYDTTHFFFDISQQ